MERIMLHPVFEKQSISRRNKSYVRLHSKIDLNTYLRSRFSQLNNTNLKSLLQSNSYQKNILLNKKKQGARFCQGKQNLGCQDFSRTISGETSTKMLTL